MLDNRGPERRAKGCSQFRACGTVITQDADFDQFMAFQADVDFTQHRWRQACIADHDDGVQMVRLGF